MHPVFHKTGLSLERLRSFAEIVAAGGISRASPENTTRQSQFSRQLKELEEFFGAELVQRGRGRFTLTGVGRELFQIVQSHLKAMDALAQRCANRKMEMSIGAGESLLQWVILPETSKFLSLHPDITLALKNLRTAEIAKRLVDGRIDIGLLRQDAVRSPLKSSRLGAIEYSLVVPSVPGEEWNAKTMWAKLALHRLALVAESDVTIAFEREAEQNGVSLDICLRGSSYPQMIQAVQEMKCATILPTLAAPFLGRGCKVVPVPSLRSFSRVMALAWHPRSTELTPAIAGVIVTLSQRLRRQISLAPGKKRLQG